MVELKLKEISCGAGRDLGNGHAVMEYKSAWGRPIAKWIEGYGPEAKVEIDKILCKISRKVWRRKSRSNRYTES